MNAGCARALGMSSETKGLKRHRIIYSHVVPNLFLRYIGVQSTLEESEFNGTEKKGLLYISYFKSSQVTFIYIAPLTIQIVTKHCTISK